ncbi:carboxypeptidase regulatory-like domain-containing protein [Cellulomonas sp. DKR-3]|uniref:Carboxypeptidase regulatory-like domain-containing protein n=1 Tax=Cellulomonas fulva TaxID=2835530 RepID=A0ABS5TY34_9CELL|nr:carboxypeptidase-like regulatory domain-containing protein [Cellulomonas fulva]MBT0994064.1 carboxypeptidase regulatory-like domain-containing protein [Cellulomonas fulva]
MADDVAIDHDQGARRTMFSARLAALVVATALATATAFVPAAAPADAAPTVTTKLTGRALLPDGSAASRVEVLAADAARPLRDPDELVVASAPVGRAGAFTVSARTAAGRGVYLRITTPSADHVTQFVGRGGTHAAAYPLLEPITAGGTVEVGTQILVERGALTVTVGAPVSCVRLLLLDGSPVRQSCGSRDSTAWSFTRLAPGRYRVSVLWEFGMAEAGSAEVRVSPSRTTSVRVAVGTRTGLAGTITDPAGRPAAGVGVLAVRAADGAMVGGTTDARGRYFLLGLPPGGWHLMVNTDEAGRTREGWSGVERKVAVQAGEVDEVDVHLTVEGRISVTARSTAGQWVRLEVHDATGRLRAVTNGLAAGPSTTLAVGGLAPGTYGIVLTSQGRYADRAGVVVRRGTTTAVGPLTASDRTVTVHGRVVGVADDERVTVAVRPTQDPQSRERVSVITEPGGAFEVDRLVPGGYEVEVSTYRDGLGWGYRRPVHVDAVLGTSWTLPAPVRVERELVHAQTTVLWRGRPAPDVFVDDGRFSGGALRNSGQTDAAGSTTLEWDGRVVTRLSARAWAIPAPLVLDVASPLAVDGVDDLTQVVVTGVVGE